MSEAFVDTSAFYALLVSTDRYHNDARIGFDWIQRNTTNLITSSLVLQETVSLLQARIGIEAVRRFNDAVTPALETVWIDDILYNRAMAALLAAGSRAVSLTDWSSFEVMRSRSIAWSFTFDRHFAEQGFISILELVDR